MGDRANIAIKQQNGGHVVLYAHWDGYRIKSILQRALKKRWRWDDDAFLARIIFSEMTKGQEDKETGFGISTSVLDFNVPTLVVDCEKQTVSETTENAADLTVLGHEHSFSDFCKLKKGWGLGSEDDDAGGI